MGCQTRHRTNVSSGVPARRRSGCGFSFGSGKMSFALRLTIGGIAVAAAAVVLFETERPPMDSIQRGYRGTGMQQVYNPRFLADELAANKIPASLPPLGNAGPKASAVY